MKWIKLIKNWFFNHKESKLPMGPATILALVIEENEKTIQVNYNNRIARLQKSLIKFKPYKGNQVAITIPFWLFALKFPMLKK